MPTWSCKRPWLFALCLAHAGCAADDGEGIADGGGSRDGGPDADADIPGDGPLPDAYEGCGLEESYGAVIALDQGAYRMGEPGFYEWKLVGLLGQGVQLDMVLREDVGSFAGIIPTPGDYAISGVDADPTTCGLCLSVSMTGSPDRIRLYHAMAGNLTLTAVDDERLTGEATDVTLERFDPIDRQPLSDGCQTTIASFPFDAEVEVFVPL